MKNTDKETRLVVLKFPEELATELNVLSRFNVVSMTEFVVTATELLMEQLYTAYPELSELPPAPLRTRTRCEEGEFEYPDDEEEPVLIAAEDED